ncbi:MAG TPA: alpha-2-macroglobulin family protein [Acetobacteraceae bacterium]
MLRQGGDEGGFVLPDIPQRTVTLFTPPVQAGTDGRALIPLDMPDFNGQVRLMVVAWEGSKLGAANSDLTVRDPLVAEELLPRFLAPGDKAQLTVLLHNLDLPAGEAAAKISLYGPLALGGPDRLAADLAHRAHVAAVWVGRPDGTALLNAAGRDLALPMLGRVFALLPSAPRPILPPPPPSGMPSRPADALRLLFPPTDAELSGAGPATLRAMGGQRPLTFMIDGAPLKIDPARREASWLPPAPGFYRVVVVDADGAMAQAAIRIR